MNRSALALFALVIGLAACGDRPRDPEEPGNPSTSGDGIPSERAAPLAVGDVAPSFEGLPAGPVVLVFYRGHW